MAQVDIEMPRWTWAPIICGEFIGIHRDLREEFDTFKRSHKLVFEPNTLGLSDDIREWYPIFEGAETWWGCFEVADSTLMRRESEFPEFAYCGQYDKLEEVV